MTATPLDDTPLDTRLDRAHPGQEPGGLASVSKALMLLESLTAAGDPAGVSALARRTGMPKSTAFRLLAYLEESGFVERSGKAYQLGRRLFELGNRVDLCRPDGLRDIALPHLTDLHTRTGMVVHLGVLDGHDVVYLDKVHGLRTAAVSTTIGGRVPAACTALGKAILAFSDPVTVREVVENGLAPRTRFSVRQPGLMVQQLAETRRTALAHDREESQLGISCVAAPVLVDGRAVAAVSACAPTAPVNAEAHALLVRRTAAEVSRRLHDAGASAA